MGVINSKKVKTRKKHNCFGCAREFPKGSGLEATTHAEEESIETTYWCNVCLEYWRRHMKHGDMIMFGELKSEDSEGWEQVRNEVIDS